MPPGCLHRFFYLQVDGFVLILSSGLFARQLQEMQFSFAGVMYASRAGASSFLISELYPLISANIYLKELS